MNGGMGNGGIICSRATWIAPFAPGTLGTNDMSSASIHVYAQFCIWKSVNRRKKTFCIYFSVKKCLESILKSPFCTCTWTIALSLAKKVWKKSLSGIFCAEDEGQRIWEWGVCISSCNMSPRRGATPGDIGTLKEKRRELFLVGFWIVIFESWLLQFDKLKPS